MAAKIFGPRKRRTRQHASCSRRFRTLTRYWIITWLACGRRWTASAAPIRNASRRTSARRGEVGPFERRPAYSPGFIRAIGLAKTPAAEGPLVKNDGRCFFRPPEEKRTPLK